MRREIEKIKSFVFYKYEPESRDCPQIFQILQIFTSIFFKQLVGKRGC